MGNRLRVLIAAVLVVIPAVDAQANEYVACWRDTRFDPVLSDYLPVTRCRLAGGEIVDYASDDEVPTRLYPAVGSVAGVPCWYYTSTFSGLWVVFIYPNGDADIALGADPSEWVIVGLYARCTAEPDETDPTARIWEYVTEYIHPPPTPDLSPSPGNGVTGLETFLSVPLPDRHTATLTSGGTSLTVEIWVGAVVVHWGDGTITTHPADGPSIPGYPNGPARHTYETINPDGRLSVAYRWGVRWRASGGPWQPLTVPPTTTTVGYPVTEIVAILGD